jgi:D-alanyl-D-alanine carboxypeptidase/D-alanyl-D-alanine-endopeptidase (penicillin-binding protein 4)
VKPARLPAAAAALLLFIAAPCGRAGAVDRRLGADAARPVATGVPWSAGAVARLNADIDALLDGAPTLHGAHVGLIAIDTRSGALLYARKPDDAFAPASTLKLLTGSVALARLGAAYRFRTQALLDPANSVLTIRAGGDPLLRAADLDALARNVRAAGITALPGGLRIDPSAFEAAAYPPGWAWDDFPYDYAPVLSAATVEENVVHLTVAPGAAPGAAVTVTGAPVPFERFGPPPNGCPPGAAIAVSVTATTGERDGPQTLDLERTGGCIAIRGSLALGSAPQTLDAAVPSPVWYLHHLADNALRVAGVVLPPAAEVSGSADEAAGAPAGARVVWTHVGEPLSDLLADLWWPSDNLVAELLLRAIGLEANGIPGSTANGITAERAWLAQAGLDPASVTLADGSGLSAYDRITPRILGAVLQADWNGPYRNLVLDDLPLAGARGTLRNSWRGSLAEGRTFAKTGSMNHVRGLAGYLATLHHGALTFAWTVDDWMGSDDDLDALRARVLSRFIGD